MPTIILENSTGSDEVDQILKKIVHAYETEFFNYIRAYYVIGSYSDGSGIPLSDIDCGIIFKEATTPQQLDRAWTLAKECASFSPIRLDIGLDLEQHLDGRARTLFKLGSLFVYGEDIRDQLVLPPINEYQQYATWGPYRFLGQVVRDVEVLTYPLTYPDSNDQFYGYARKRVEAWYPADVKTGTKEIVTGITRTATALVALQAERHVGTKKASVELYKKYIADEWADLVEAWYRKGKLEWHYAIPADPADQQLLSDLCQQTLAFENHYFRHYKDYLAKLSNGTREEQQFAAERLSQVCYPNT